MAISVENVKVAVCDACGNRSYHTPEEFVPGVLASVRVNEDWGGLEIFFYSCLSTPDHVGRAFYSVLQRTLDEETTVIPVVTDVFLVDPPSGEVAISSKRQPGNPNPKSDSELLEDLKDICDTRGVVPSKDAVKKLLHIGDRRVNLLFDMLLNSEDTSNLAD